jgi:hypothetical protein
MGRSRLESTLDKQSRPSHERIETPVNDTDGRRFVPALRKAWESLQSEAFSELGQRIISGADLRAYLGKSLAARGERNRSVRAWNRLPPAARDAALLAAFPGESYSRTPPSIGGGN